MMLWLCKLLPMNDLSLYRMHEALSPVFPISILVLFSFLSLSRGDHSLSFFLLRERNNGVHIWWGMEWVCGSWIHSVSSSQLIHSFYYSEDGKQYGSITISAEEQSKGRQESLYFICSASNVDRKDFLGKCDPFLKISRINYDNTWVNGSSSYPVNSIWRATSSNVSGHTVAKDTQFAVSNSHIELGTKSRISIRNGSQ